MREYPFTPLQGVSPAMRDRLQTALDGQPAEVHKRAAQALVTLEARFTDRFEQPDSVNFVWGADPLFRTGPLSPEWRQTADALAATGLVHTHIRQHGFTSDEGELRLSEEYRVTLLLRCNVLPRWRRKTGHYRVARRASALLDLFSANTQLAVRLDPIATIATLHQLCSPRTAASHVQATSLAAVEQIADAGVGVTDYVRVLASIGTFPGPVEDLTSLALAVLT